MDGHRRVRTPPRPDDLAFDEDGTRPDTRGPERAAAVRVRDEELAIGSLEEEVGVATRKEPRRSRCLWRGRNVGSSRPRIHASPTGVRTGVNAPASAIERLDASPLRDPRPLCERLRRRRAEDMQVSPRELEAGAHGIDRRCAARSRSSAIARRPTGSRPFRSVPRTGAGWGARRGRGRPRRTSSPSRRGGLQPSGQVLSQVPSAGSSGSLPSEKTARSRAGTTYAWCRGPQSWTSDGSSHVDGWVASTRAWIERTAARGMLSCRPAHAACRNERRPRGSRTSRAPTCRRNARICGRVRRSRDVVTVPPDRLLCPSFELEQTWLPRR